ncbi:hypothetical protein Ae201684P_018025 [Aphanomyces euteiches]|nr:hypothetical protein Ae201684P_018025 [Aphanomyces euteiches]
MSSTGERNESRLTAQVSMAIQMPPSYVGLTQYAIQVTQRPSSRTSVLKLDVSSQGDVGKMLQVTRCLCWACLHQLSLSIGSIRPDSLVPFNTSGTIELSDVAVGMSDAVTIHVRNRQSCRGEICGACFVVQTVDN